MRKLCEFLSLALSFFGMIGGIGAGVAFFLSSGLMMGVAVALGVSLPCFAFSAIISLLASIDERLEAASKRAP